MNVLVKEFNIYGQNWCLFEWTSLAISSKMAEWILCTMSSKMADYILLAISSKMAE